MTSPGRVDVERINRYLTCTGCCVSCSPTAIGRTSLTSRPRGPPILVLSVLDPQGIGLKATGDGLRIPMSTFTRARVRRRTWSTRLSTQTLTSPRSDHFGRTRLRWRRHRHRPHPVRLSNLRRSRALNDARDLVRASLVGIGRLTGSRVRDLGPLAETERTVPCLPPPSPYSERWMPCFQSGTSRRPVILVDPESRPPSHDADRTESPPLPRYRGAVRRVLTDVVQRLGRRALDASPRLLQLISMPAADAHESASHAAGRAASATARSEPTISASRRARSLDESPEPRRLFVDRVRSTGSRCTTRVRVSTPEGPIVHQAGARAAFPGRATAAQSRHPLPRAGRDAMRDHEPR